jgi:hypothetical protein
MMRRFRFSIAGLLALVGLAALGSAAIRVASLGWSGGLFSLTILAMLTSLLGIAYQRERQRVFWVGFAVFGWTHLVLAHAPWFEGRIGPLLLGSKLFRELFPIVHPTTAGAMGGMGGGGMGGTGGGALSGFRQIGVRGGSAAGIGAAATGLGGGPILVNPVNISDFLSIGQSLETLLWAFLGGCIARYFSMGRTDS